MKDFKLSWLGILSIVIGFGTLLSASPSLAANEAETELMTELKTEPETELMTELKTEPETELMIELETELKTKSKTELLLLDDMAVEVTAFRLNKAAPFTGAALLDVELWEDGVLPVTFARSVTPEKKAMFMLACDEWRKVARVRCIEGKYKQRRLLVTEDVGQCWSLAGMGANIGPLQRRMNLRGNCWRHDVILHELGHAFGLIHEHQRPDRDQYIEILSENVEGGFLGLQLKVNFDRKRSDRLTQYDFLSIMHYPRRAFSKNGQDTIRPLPPYSQYADLIGVGKFLSKRDGLLMASLYGEPLRRSEH